MPLYLIDEGPDPIGDLDRTLVVKAPTPEAAVRHWQDYYDDHESTPPRIWHLNISRDGPIRWRDPGGASLVEFSPSCPI